MLTAVVCVRLAIGPRTRRASATRCRATCVRSRPRRTGTAVVLRCRPGGEPELVDQDQFVTEQRVDYSADGVVGESSVEGLDEVTGGDATVASHLEGTRPWGPRER